MFFVLFFLQAAKGSKHRFNEVNKGISSAIPKRKTRPRISLQIMLRESLAFFTMTNVYLVPAGTFVVYAALCLSPPADTEDPPHQSSQPEQTAPSNHMFEWLSC